MGAFHGTWQWVQGNDTIRIYLTTKKIHDNIIPGGFYWDRLLGWHIYKKGTLVIQSSYVSIDNIYTKTFRGGNENDSTQVEGTIKDITKNKLGELTLTLNTSQNQLT